MSIPRALLFAIVPAILVFLVFRFWLGLSVPVALAAGALWGVVSLVLTRVLYDDADSELEAWRSAAPDLADDERKTS